MRTITPPSNLLLSPNRILYPTHRRHVGVGRLCDRKRISDGVADPTLGAAATPAANTAATDMLSIRLDIGFLRVLGQGIGLREGIPRHGMAKKFDTQGSLRRKQ